MQFLTLISNDVSLTPEMYERHLAVTLRILNTINKKNLTKETPRQLAFFISFLGKNSIQDETIVKLRDSFYKKFKDGQGNIFDIVEVYGSLLNLKMFSIEDLEKLNLHKNFKLVRELSTSENKIQHLRYFEILATG